LRKTTVSALSQDEPPFTERRSTTSIQPPSPSPAPPPTKPTAVALVQHVPLREGQQRAALAAPCVVRVDQDRDLEAVDEALRQAGHRLAVREDGHGVAPRRLAGVSERRPPA